MNTSTLTQNQLLATKFFVPVTSGALIARPRLNALLGQSLKFPLTLVSAPAGFGKTTFLSTWGRSLSVSTARLCWLSLDEEDNDPQLFWTGVLSALDRQLPDHFAPLLLQLQSPPCPPLKQLLAVLINQLAESMQHFVLILDDYQVITQEQVHTTLSYLVQHLPPQLRIIIATRADPPLPLPMQRARHHILEVRTDQLRCTVEETKAFFHEVIGIHLPDETIQEIRSRTEGWLVGLQLLGLSLPERVDPLTLLKEVSGDQRYILDYLTEEVLRRQPQEVQTFLLSTSILEQFTASLCDAVMQQPESQQMLRQLEQANLFVVSLDSRRQWYRYHALFAEALQHQLEQIHPDLVPTLHYRASIWYAQHDQTTEAIMHALKAREWQWAADLIERLPLLLFTWKAGAHSFTILQQWLEQLPVEIVGSRPRLCLTYAQLLWAVAPPERLEAWLNTAEAMLTASLTLPLHREVSHPTSPQPIRQQQEDLLGQVISWRAYLQTFQQDGHVALALCRQALALVSAENFAVCAPVAFARLQAYYSSCANDAVAAIQRWPQLDYSTQGAGQMALALTSVGGTILHVIGAGRLHEALRLSQQAMLRATQPGSPPLAERGYVLLFQAELLREWNDINAALSLAEEAISLCQQAESIGSLIFLLHGYTVWLRICLSRRDDEAAHSAFQQIERVGRHMNEPTYLYYSAFFTVIDQVRFWLACGERDRALRWAEKLDLTERHGTPFAREREEVARARILLATTQPALALRRLEPVLARATTGQRWGHVIEIQLLQALAHQMHGEQTQALDILSEAIRLAEPEGYIRSFVDEGVPMEVLLYQLRRRDGKHGPTPYLDRLLDAFQQESKAHVLAGEHTKAQRLPEPLSERERQVLQLIEQGSSNQEIAQELVIAYDTVKRHVSHVFSKLGVSNRVQAVRQARALGLFDENPDIREV